MRNREQIKAHLINKLPDDIKGNTIIISEKDLIISVHTRNVDNTINTIQQKIGTSIHSVELDVFIDLYEDELKVENPSTPILDVMANKKFQHPVTFIEIDKGYHPLIQKLKDKGIVL